MNFKVRVTKKIFDNAEKARLSSEHCECAFSSWEEGAIFFKRFETYMSQFVYLFYEEEGEFFLEYTGALNAFGAQSLKPNLPNMAGEVVYLFSSQVLPEGWYKWEDLQKRHRPLADKETLRLKKDVEDLKKKKSQLASEMFFKKMALVEPVIRHFFPELKEGRNELGYLGYAALEYTRNERNWGIPQEKRTIFSNLEKVGVSSHCSMWNSRIVDYEESTNITLKNGSIKSFQIAHNKDMGWGQYQTHSCSERDIKIKVLRELDSEHPELKDVQISIHDF